MGRKYTLSASPLEVWTVAMLGLISTVWMFSSFSALMASKGAEGSQLVASGPCHPCGPSHRLYPGVGTHL